MAKGKVVSGTRSCWTWIIIGLIVAVVLVFGVLVFLVGPTVRGQLEASQHYAACTAFLGSGDCDQAAAECEVVVRLDTLLLYPDAPILLAQARDCQKEMHYQRGLAAMDAGEWPMAVEELKEVFEIDPSYKDVGAKLQEAKDQTALAGITPTPPPTPASPTPTDTPVPPPPAATDTPAATLTSTETPAAPTDTPIPSATQQPAPVPLSSLQTLFQDDFSNPDRGWSHYTWGGNSYMTYRDGMLELRTQADDYYKYNIAYPGVQFQDFVLEVDAQNLTDYPSVRIGTVFRARFSEQGFVYRNEYYCFEIGSDGSVEFFKRRYVGWSEDEYLLPATFHPGVNLGQDVNRIHVEAVRGEYQLFVNGQFVGKFEDPVYMGDSFGRHNYSIGDIGLYVRDPSGVNARVGFDNLVVALLDQ